MSQDSNFEHKSVLLREAVDGLCVKGNGIYVDCTAGGGGHSAEIASRLGSSGTLISVDKDVDALRHAARISLIPTGCLLNAITVISTTCSTA